MKYIKRFKNESDYQTFRGGADWITPNVSVIDDKNEVKLVPQKKVNYISYFYDGTDVWIKSTYPVTSSICVQHSLSSDVGLSYLEIGENSKKLSTLPPGEDLTTGSIEGIGFNSDDAWGGVEILEDETYIYKPYKIINFTINGYKTIPTTAYQAEVGMTWKQWVNSSYNIDGYTADEWGIYGPMRQGLPTQPMVFTLSGGWIGQDEVITNNTTYQLSD